MLDKVQTMVDGSPFSVEWLSPSREADWDAFVGRHRLGLVYDLSAWKRTLEVAFPHIRGRFLTLNDRATGEIVAGLPVYRVNSWLLGNRIVSVPFASFCNPLVSSDSELELLLPAVMEEYQCNRSRRLEIRMTDAGGQIGHPKLFRVARYKHHFLPLADDPDEMFIRFANTSVRQKVRKARRAAIEVEEVDDEKSLRVCHSILVQLRHRRTLPAIPYSFFEAMWRNLFPEHLKLLVAREKGKIVACHLVLRYKDLWTSEYCGSTVDALHGVNQLLYWEAIRRAIAEGARAFSFGRTSPANKGLLAYKRRWNPIEENIAESVLIHDRDNGKLEFIDLWARRLFKSVLRNSPLIFNRIIGSYCYRHIG